MKKTLLGIAVLGAVVGTVAYKIKKEQLEKELLDKELDMLAKKEEPTSQEEVRNDGVEERAFEAEESDDVEQEILDEELKKTLTEQSDAFIDDLKEHEDDISKERPIQHRIDFTNTSDMEAFKQKVIEKGYVVTSGDHPLQLCVLHIDAINRGELLAIVYYLANQARKYRGTYQGWQSRKALRENS